MADLTREELERELVRFDKQKLITQALKLFDTNKTLQQIIEGQIEKIRILDAEKTSLTVEVDRLEGRKWVQVLNESIERRVKRLKERNKKYTQR